MEWNGFDIIASRLLSTPDLQLYIIASLQMPLRNMRDYGNTGVAALDVLTLFRDISNGVFTIVNVCM